jgi:hypothetical protein
MTRVRNERLVHLVKRATRAFVRALQARLARHGVSFGHWMFLRISGTATVSRSAR